MRISIAQLNPTVGDYEGNMRKIVEYYVQSCNNSADLVVYTELAICGYPPQDLLFDPDFLDSHSQSLSEIINNVGDVGLVLGHIEKTEEGLFNSVSLIQDGQILYTQRKSLLPYYGEFNEPRYFKPNIEPTKVFSYKGKQMAMLVCEDIWNNGNPLIYSRDPVNDLVGRGVNILVTVNASPYWWGKGNERYKLISGVAKKLGCIVVYSNQVGGNDELVFDGRSVIISPERVIAAANPFKEEIISSDVDDPEKVGNYSFDKDSLSELYLALVLGTRDYAWESGFKKAVLGLSGGIDSAVTAVIATAALGARNVCGLLMPSSFSSQESIDDAKEIATNLGIQHHISSPFLFNLRNMPSLF